MSDSVLLADDHPVDPDDELLVAYLDDELDSASRTRVEKRLIAEPDFQKRLQSLQTGWEWLDDFPSESSNEKMVESTIELVVADVQSLEKIETPQVNSLARRFAKPLLFVLMFPMVFGVGAVAARLIAKRQLQRDLQELEIAENLEAYRLVAGEGDLKLYVKLAYDEQWQTMVQAMRRIRVSELGGPSKVATIPVSDRSSQVPSLPNETRQKLSTRWEAYSSLREETKQQVRDAAKKVSEQADQAILLQTLKAAAVWMQGLSDELRDQIQSDDSEVSEKAIDAAIELTMAELESDSGKMISDETAYQIYLWVESLLDERMASAQDDRLVWFFRLDDRSREMVKHGLMVRMIDDRTVRQWLNARMPFQKGTRNPFGGPPRGGFPDGPRRDERGPDRERQERGGPERFGAERGGERGGPDGGVGRGRGRGRDQGRSLMESPVPRITNEELAQLRELLSESALEDLQHVTSLFRRVGGESAANETLRSWASEAVKRNAPWYRDELIERYREIEKRDAFDLSPPELITQELYAPSEVLDSGSSEQTEE